MFTESVSGTHPLEVDRRLLDSLKQFKPVDRRIWRDVPDDQWKDWSWQLRNRITTIAQLQQLLPRLNPEEKSGGMLANQKLSLAITPYYGALLDPDNLDCPMRRQVVPRIEETRTESWEMNDPCGEDIHSPVPGLVHRYPDRVLLLVTNRCASYCRYCTRSRFVGNVVDKDFHRGLGQRIEYIRQHREIRDVLLSGGDPLLLSDEKLDALLGRLRAIPHIEFLRIGTRIPIFLPQRITSGLCAVLKRHHPLFISIHTNHPAELTPDSRMALTAMADSGIPLGNQSVLLRGVNDEITVMLALVQKLLLCRVKPYYLYQCDLIAGSAHLRTSVECGLRLMRGLRGFTSGYAVPQYVIDTPRGGGKIPINPEYIIQRNAERVLLRNFEGKIFEYPEPADGMVSDPLALPNAEPAGS